jgi:AcrR family transcriptional regulator
MVPRTTEPVRPRVAGAREDEILEAAVDELLTVGYDRLTMDGVAQRARASKATLYRRWVSKQALVVDAVCRAKRTGPLEVPDTGSLRGDLVELFAGRGGLANQINVRLLGGVITAVHTDPEFAAEFRGRFLAPKIMVAQEIYRRAAERGELAEGVDLSILGPALAGILLHRSFVLGDEITRDLVERVVDQVVLPAATGSRPPCPTAKSHHQENR